jgi:hypothetical protein
LAAPARENGNPSETNLSLSFFLKRRNLSVSLSLGWMERWSGLERLQREREREARREWGGQLAVVTVAS